MSSKLQMGGVTVVMTLGLMFGLGAGWASAEEQKKQGGGDVKERAVPMQKVPLQPEGIILQDNQIRALPGYQLQVGPNNTVSAMRINGGLGFSGECACVGTGSCYEKETTLPGGPTVQCTADAGTPCSGKCDWVNKQPNAAFRGAAAGAATGGQLQRR